MLFETISDVRQKISAGLMGTLAAEFPTEPGTFRLKDNTQGNYKLFGRKTRVLKQEKNVIQLVNSFNSKKDFQRTETDEQLP